MIPLVTIFVRHSAIALTSAKNFISAATAASTSATACTGKQHRVSARSRSPKQYELILKVIPKCEDITPVNRERLKALAGLQRW